MATAMPSVDSREVVRCDLCLLVQFSPKNLSAPCRRCRKPLDYDPNPAPPPAPEPPALIATPDLRAEVAANIRSLRLSRGLSQRQVASRMSVPRSYISKCERGTCTPTLASLKRLALALGVSISDMVGGGDRIREQQISELMADSLIAEIVPFLPPLGELQRRQILQSVHELSVRPKRAV